MMGDTHTARRVYVATSWHNRGQPPVVAALRDLGHLVYDFRRPRPADAGFHWSDVDPDHAGWTLRHYAATVRADSRCQKGFAVDRAALDWCDTCLLLLPCGRSAHLEAGYAKGQGKRLLIWLDDREFRPELMYLFADAFVFDIAEAAAALAAPAEAWRARR